MKSSVVLRSVCLGRSIARDAGTWDMRKRILQTEAQTESNKCNFLLLH